MWQPRFYDRVLRADEAIAAVVAYILANPVRRGLAPIPGAYPWSALVDPPSV